MQPEDLFGKIPFVMEIRLEIQKGYLAEPHDGTGLVLLPSPGRILDALHHSGHESNGCGDCMETPWGMHHPSWRVTWVGAFIPIRRSTYPVSEHPLFLIVTRNIGNDI